MDEVGITIIGAGVVGLAIAAELSRSYDNIVVLERHDTIGQETSSRNSEVIHSGIYYPGGSLKARLCVEGMSLLYEYCERRSVRHSRIGKLIVASETAEIADLEELMRKGIRNGVGSLRLLDRDETTKMEQNVNAVAAIYSPDTGIIDAHGLMNSLYHEAESGGVMFSFGSDLNAISRNEGGYVLGMRNDDYTFLTRVVVNSAGLSSDRVAELAGIDPDQAGYRLRYCKGSYFSYAKKSPVKRLIYPVPHKELTGLGVHANLDLDGHLKFGPDAEYMDKIDYIVDASKKDAFVAGALKIINGLDPDSFCADMAGVRPKIRGEGIKDFVIRHEADRGLPGLINLVGIESPGLTASLSIARYVSSIVRDVMT